MHICWLLMRFRNNHPAFNLDGSFKVELENSNELKIIREYKEDYAILHANLKTFDFTIEHS